MREEIFHFDHERIPERDVHGFAMQLDTQEGNWDIVGNTIPVFFIQDAIKFPDIIHAVQQEPDRGFPQAATAHDNFWDFISLTPESMHMVMSSGRLVCRTVATTSSLCSKDRKDVRNSLQPAVSFASGRARRQLSKFDILPTAQAGV